MISVYDSRETNFNHNGLVVLSDTISCPVDEELNGAYELTLEYPIDSRGKWKYLTEENILKVDGQLFRIYHKDKNLSSIKINARHIFYDLLDNFLEDVRPTDQTGFGALDWILTHTQFPHPFTSMGDVGGNNTRYFVRANPVDAILGDEGIIATWGGELIRDNYTIKLLNARGLDRGVLISYGKNIQGIEETLDMDGVCTRLMPIGTDALLLPEKYIDSQYINNFPHPKIRTQDFEIGVDEDNGITNDMAIAQLRTAATNYMLSGIDIPRFNYKIDFLELSKTEEYRNYAILETVYLGDTVTIRHSKLGIDLKAKVIKTTKNVLTDRLETIELGNFKPNIATSIDTSIREIKQEIDKDKSEWQEAVDNATSLLINSAGGYVIKKDGELFIMDTEDVNTATKVWRWNLNGLGYSSTGVNGPYGLAMTMDGQIVGSFIVGLLGEFAQVNGDQIIGTLGEFVKIRANQIILGDAGETIAGDLLDGSETWNSVASNFNKRNDRLPTIPADPVIASDGSAVDHTINTDGSVNISFEWTYDGDDRFYNIDGFIIYINQSTSDAEYTFGNSLASEHVVYTASDKRAFILYGVPADKYYTFGISAYRMVDQDIDPSGLLRSQIIKSTASGENPYQPSMSVSYGGDVTGTISGTPASTVVYNANTAMTNLNDFLTSTYPSDMSDLQNQMDGKITTYYQTTDPNTWSVADRPDHNGDMWYNASTRTLQRYDSSTNTWSKIEDQKAIDAYSVASIAQDTADGKRRVFISQPYPPYDVGDLWSQGASGDLMRCATARSSGSYYPSDWVKASKYTDDTTANSALSTATTAQQEAYNAMVAAQNALQANSIYNCAYATSNGFVVGNVPSGVIVAMGNFAYGQYGIRASHTDGSYTQLTANGLQRVVAGDTVPIQYETYVVAGTTVGISTSDWIETSDPQYATDTALWDAGINLIIPHRFQNKNFNSFLTMKSFEIPIANEGGTVRMQFYIKSIDRTAYYPKINIVAYAYDNAFGLYMYQGIAFNLIVTL